MEVLLVAANADEPSGPEVVHKTASLPEERERLLRESEVLRMASERGVAGLATVISPPSGGAAEPTLVTSAVTGPSLALAGPLPLCEVAGVAAAVANLLAGLHEAGLVHGSLEPGHVVLDGAGGLILVGLGDGGEVGEPATADALDASLGHLDPATDVAGWGMLVSHLLNWSAAGEEEPLIALRRTLGGRPARRRRSARPPSPSADDDRRVLAALADQAQGPDPAHRPTARSLAAAVTHRVPDARMPGAIAPAPSTPGRPTGLFARLPAHLAASPAGRTGDLPTESLPEGPTPDLWAGTPRPDRPPGDWSPFSRGRRASRPAPGRTRDIGPGAAEDGAQPLTTGLLADHLHGDEASAAAAASSRGGQGSSVAAFSGGGAQPGEPPRRPTMPPAATPARMAIALAAAIVLMVSGGLAARGRHPVGSPASPTTAAPPQAACPPAAGPSADIDGDGCEESVRWADGVLTAGTARFALGAPGDAWALGDWSCDGRRTPALLQDGSLVLFDAWPGPGGELAGRPAVTVAGALSLSAVPGPDGCDRPSIHRPGAADVVVDARAKP